MTNMTYTEAITYALEVLNSEDVIAHGGENHNEVISKLEALKGQIEKRSTSKTPSKTQKENEVIMDRMAEVLSSLESPVTVSELIASSESFEGMSNQKASALLKKLVEAGRAVKTIEKKKSYFSIA